MYQSRRCYVAVLHKNFCLLLKVLELAGNVCVQMDKVLRQGPKSIFKGEGNKVYKGVGNRRRELVIS